MRISGGTGGNGVSRNTSGALLSDTQAQSVVTGAILMFALGVLLLGIVQATTIPNANEKVENQHSQQVRGQMQDLRNDIGRSAESGQDFSQGIKLGTEYPSRVLFINPGEPAGIIATAGTTDEAVAINITNAQARDPETADFWNGTSRLYGTGAVVYETDYNVYRNSPEATVIENSLVYSKFEGGTTLLATDQRVVDGREISLVAIDGRLSRSQVEQYTVDARAVSAPSQTILVENTSSSEPIRVNITTRLSEETLIQDVFRSEIDADGGAPSATECSNIAPGFDSTNDRFIDNCEFDPTAPGEFNNFTLVMEPNTAYELKLAKVGVGAGVDDLSAAYITDIEGDGTSVPLGGTSKVVVQVRDNYNNPISNEKVTFSLEGGSTLFTARDVGTTINVTTDETGRAVVGYRAPNTISSSPQPVEIDVSYTANAKPVDSDPDFDRSDPDDLTLNLDVINASQTSNTRPLFNPPNGLVLNGAIADGSSSECQGGGGGNACTLTVEWENTGSTDVTIEGVRYVFYSSDSEGNSPSANPGGAILTEATGQEDEVDPGDPELVQGGELVDVPGNFLVEDGTTKNITFVVYSDLANRNDADIDESEFIVITLKIDGKTETYFIAPSNP